MIGIDIVIMIIGIGHYNGHCNQISYLLIIFSSVNLIMFIAFMLSLCVPPQISDVSKLLFFLTWSAFTSIMIIIWVSVTSFLVLKCKIYNFLILFFLAFIIRLFYIYATISDPKNKELGQKINSLADEHIESQKKYLFNKECAICYETIISQYVLVPCGHTSICLVCLSNFEIKNQCPICKSNIEKCIKIYQ